MQLYGVSRSRREVEARVGRLGQIGGVRRLRLTEGKDAEMDIIEVRTGAGLALEITPDKGMDISRAELWGVPLSWQSANGDVHPMHYEAEGTDWLRTASGGLLMTCGLSHIGSPSSDETGSYGLHGRIHHTPARQISVCESWDGDELNWSVAGVVEETVIFGSKLRLLREISGRLGDNRIVINDRVENFGFQPAVHMMLYHFNFGFPLLGDHTCILLPDAESERRGASGSSLDEAASWQAPDPTISETVYYHRVRKGETSDKSMAQVHIVNPVFPIADQMRPTTVSLSWTRDTLPLLVQWRMPGAGEHVLGLEPANCRVEGRETQRRSEGLPMLQPGECICYRLELNVSP